MWVAWLVPILVGIAVNAVVGALVAYARIPSIVVTLGMLSILKGGLISATGGAWITDMPPDFMHRPDAALRHSRRRSSSWWS